MLFASKEQQLAIPCGAAKALDEFHPTVFLQMLPGMIRHVPPDFKGLKVVKVGATQLPEPPGCRAVTFPRLRLKQEMLADGGQAREQLRQASVSVVQVDPHGDCQAETQVEPRAAMLTEVDFQLLGVFSDVQSDEGDAVLQRVGLLCPLNKTLIQIKSQQVHFSSTLVPFRLRHQMLVKGYAQFLTNTETAVARRRHKSYTAPMR